MDREEIEKMKQEIEELRAQQQKESKRSIKKKNVAIAGALLLLPGLIRLIFLLTQL